MKRHRNPQANLPRPSKPKTRPPKRPTPGDLIVRARTAELLWRVAHAARATTWAPEMADCGAAAYAVLDDAIDALDAHVRAGGA